jgi:hypothetical protein
MTRNQSICLGKYVFTVMRPEGVWAFPLRGPKWPRKHSPVFALGDSPSPELALKGPLCRAGIGSEPLNRIAYAVLAPSGRNVYFDLPRVNLA